MNLTATTADLIEGFCKFIGGRDDIWYATNIEIVDYMNAAKILNTPLRVTKFTTPTQYLYGLKLTVNITKSNRRT